ncbi:urea carboxylase [Colwellia sp. 1_MG-2023]|uniref:urea carboxylase n=1 Tax=unclassified Colwellia TaxID=196834 RepID=UPI001C0977D8|nr:MULTISPECIES: urea carboxylase [unclassified Colwellia]MBU2924498.1 urea carboxylase [Colwellia sp. C2M11]MDO6652909.1 urea carboxylase [Colwellia sp. 3_MG-2023]MDO6665391.1 urea carboxylase [Colwellia sp. 2_MG-2023]MDO6689850.1 urea carboxylase [Colwellia sp. 1_MG-2023]
MFTKVLIANRGAIACRIIRTLSEMGVQSVSIYSLADADSLHVSQADEAYSLGEGGAKQTYLDIEKVIAIAKECGAQAIHPGYGFLSENVEFVRACEENDLVFLGPTPEQMLEFGLKHRAREIAEEANVPLLPGSDLLEDLNDALTCAEKIGYPVMLKSTAGGGGIGMQRCNSAEELSQAYDSVKRLSENNFSNSALFLEKFIVQARHIEVQIFGDGEGYAIALGERDCSAQRRNQKVIEECPAPNLADDVRQQLHSTATRLAASVNYRNAGTVEFVFDQQDQKFYFLEVNTRLQVEHGVTELVYNVDLVNWMVCLAAKELAPLAELEKTLVAKGHAIQVRMYAEDANKSFQPSAGLISHVKWATEVDQGTLRIDHWLESGTEVSPFFDPMLAKVICHSKTREQALTGLKQALIRSEIYGIETNKDYLHQLLSSKVVEDAELLTQTLNSFVYSPCSIDVLAGGTQTTIQDYPGRKGYWNIGVPPSGPMDSVSFRLANTLLGNTDDAAGLEITVSGPTLRFNSATRIVLAGATIDAELDNVSVTNGVVINVEAGQTLTLGNIKGAGSRAYLAVQEGIQCPDYLGSKSTFTLGQFGGHAGRALRTGDVLSIADFSECTFEGTETQGSTLLPDITDEWTIRVIYGPHGAPDFFCPEDIDAFFDATWKVHFNSSRTGVRLMGPKPKWARNDGGEAGLHPSNIHDNAYAVGTIDFTGDMPVILGPDGPSLGGFVCPVTIIKADLWKVGQLKAGASIRFQPVSILDAQQLETQQIEQLQSAQFVEQKAPTELPESAIIKTIDKSELNEQVVYRASGEDYLLVEYGEQVLDVALRFRVHALMLKLQEMNIAGIEELTPGIRSLQIHYDNLLLPQATLLDLLAEAEQALGDVSQLTVPSRIVHIPLSWDDYATRLAIKKYDELVRKDAPWCPDNIEFIRRINGLDSVEEVKEIVFNASYLVMGLGDVYLGAPVATPLDPRHRLVTTKYNPARTWTPENAVGIGGAYLCVYGMEGPGGYQFVGRTLQMWNRYRKTAEFQKPWLLRFFDQIKFYSVSSEELTQIRHDFPRGDYPLKIEETTFSLAQYQESLSENQESIVAFKDKQQKAFEAERQQWQESGQANFVADEMTQVETDVVSLTAEQRGVDSHVAGNIWKILVKPGEKVTAGQPLLILEAMKMEIEVVAPAAGTVASLVQKEGAQVHAGQRLLILEKN